MKRAIMLIFLALPVAVAGCDYSKPRDVKTQMRATEVAWFYYLTGKKLAINPNVKTIVSHNFVLDINSNQARNIANSFTLFPVNGKDYVLLKTMKLPNGLNQKYFVMRRDALVVVLVTYRIEGKKIRGQFTVTNSTMTRL